MFAFDSFSSLRLMVAPFVIDTTSFSVSAFTSLKSVTLKPVCSAGSIGVVVVVGVVVSW